MYRPEGWLDIHINYDECQHDWLHIGELKSGERRLAEAGADAMLKGLREKGEHFTKEQIAKLLDPAKEPDDWDLPGTYVFIPDDK